MTSESHRLDRDTLLSRDGIGPWTTDYKHDHDYVRNAALKNELREVSPRELYGVADRLFFRVHDLSCHVFGQEHRFDLFAARELLHFLPDFMYDTIRDAPYSYGLQIGRLWFAQEQGHQGSGDALATLHNVARQGGRVAFIHAHGGTEDGAWRIHSGQRSSGLAENIARDLASKKGEGDLSKYQAAFFSSCNEAAIELSMNGITIPVIANMAMNGVEGGDARVYFPEAS